MSGCFCWILSCSVESLDEQLPPLFWKSDGASSILKAFTEGLYAPLSLQSSFWHVLFMPLCQKHLRESRPSSCIHGKLCMDSRILVHLTLVWLRAMSLEMAPRGEGSSSSQRIVFCASWCLRRWAQTFLRHHQHFKTDATQSFLILNEFFPSPRSLSRLYEA